MASTFRAIENELWFVQCANAGISAIIDPCGRILARLGLNQEDYLIAN
jgi:apolipoprotein N-acyltransferase